MKFRINIDKIRKQLRTNFKFRYFFYAVCFLLFLFCLLAFWEIYIPRSPSSNHTITYIAKSGQGDDEIAKDLEEQGIIKSNYFFRFYVIVSFQHAKLQAGKYLLSPNMSIYQIVKKIVFGDVIKQKITILEGWDLDDIGKYFQTNGVLSKKDFEELAKRDFSNRFDFLNDKPKDVSLEGYLFPDTYEVFGGGNGEDIFKNILSNFDKKITPDLTGEITAQKKSIFEIITVASLIEKEVKLVSDKKTVSGIIWKRLKLGMPLQIDATINYITGKNDPGVAIKDTKIDSPYNTYKYKGLPKGPISNPGIESISAAIYPKDTQYLFYLSGFDGRTIFSKTLAEHNVARAKYLKKY